MTPRVLIVDDDQVMLDVLRGVLEDQGMSVTTAANGRDAVNVVERASPDLVVLDVTLPVLSSSNVAARVRAMGTSPVPVLVITADGHAREKARQLGAYTYLRKPFDLVDFVKAVRVGLEPRT